MAEIEKTDPDNGQPWSQPNGGYDPWDPKTFASGAYGARFPGTSGGGVVPGESVSVAIALAMANNKKVKVIGKSRR